MFRQRVVALGIAVKAFALCSAVLVAMLVAMPATVRAENPALVKIGYLRRPVPGITISLPEQPTPDAGIAGAKLANDDNNTTGKFLQQKYDLTDIRIASGEDPAAAVKTLSDAGVKLVLLDLDADQVLKAADAGRSLGMLFFNVGAPDDRLREQDCRADVIHVPPSRAMLADALAQYLVWKKWTKWLLIFGSHPADTLLADAYRQAAKRTGGKIVEEREFKDTGGARRTDSGIAQVQTQIPVFTQEAPAHDVVVAADESDVFAEFLPYRTWDARPVTGSAGLRPTMWDATHNQWGAVQIQERFRKTYHRGMTALDAAAWAAGRMIGEGVIHAQSVDPKTLLAYFRGPDFALSAYKGERLTLRTWSQQLRQPVLLGDGRTIVSVSPQVGFLHPVTELDTLGGDERRTKCVLQ